MFIYRFGYFHFKQRLQKRRIAELVIRSSNNQMTCSAVQSHKFESGSSRCEFSPSNKPKNTRSKIDGVNKILQ